MRPHLHVRYLHRGNCHLLATAMSPEPSCRECADKIHKFESEVINNNFGDPRAGWGIKSKKRRGRNRSSVRTHFNAYGINEKSDQITEYPVSKDMPISIHFEHTGEPPSIFTGKNIPTGNRKMFKSGVNFNNLPRPHILKSRPVRTGNFTRFAAKVAHSYASAVLGPHGFEPWLANYIVEGNTTNPYLVGIAPLRGEGSRLHQIGLKIQAAAAGQIPGLPSSLRDLVVVHLELFAPFRPPVLEIVVGELIRRTP
jgi:hypothetical protein